MKWEKGNWQVVRNCCTSGNCSECREVRGFPFGVPARIVHADNYSEAYARYVAGNWPTYKATAEPMPS